MVVNWIERYRYMINSKLVLSPNHETSIITDRTFAFPHIINLVENRQLNDQTEKYKHMSACVNHINQLNGADNGAEPTIF